MGNEPIVVGVKAFPCRRCSLGLDEPRYGTHGWRPGLVLNATGRAAYEAYRAGKNYRCATVEDWEQCPDCKGKGSIPSRERTLRELRAQGFEVLEVAL